jgi:hypothetical protein
MIDYFWSLETLEVWTGPLLIFSFIKLKGTTLIEQNNLTVFDKTLGVSVFDTLEILLHACPHYIGRKKNVYLFKKVSFDYKCVFKDFDSCYLC